MSNVLVSSVVSTDASGVWFLLEEIFFAAVDAASRNLDDAVKDEIPLLTFTLVLMALICSATLILLYRRSIMTFGRNINSKAAMQMAKMSNVIVR